MIRILQSTVERALYLILLLVFAGVLIEVPFAISVVHHLDEEQLQIKQGVQEIEKQQQCIATFFNQPPVERISNLKLSSLDVCKSVVK